MGSDDMQLRVLATSSIDASERKHAASVLRLLKRGRHWVLVVRTFIPLHESTPDTENLSSGTAPRKRRKHLLPPRLLISNKLIVNPPQIVNESLPIFLDDVLGGNGFRAVIISTIGIVIFGEVIPQVSPTRI